MAGMIKPLNSVYDQLISRKCYIVRSARVKIDHTLLVKPGTKPEDIREIWSHEQAIQQCSDFLSQNKQWQVNVSSNTAAAAEYVASTADKNIGAIASRQTASLYGLEVLEAGINSAVANQTRFAVFSRARNKTSQPETEGEHFILVFTVRNEAGALAKILNIIGSHGFNMSSLHSRPVAGPLWNHYFFAELEGGVGTENGRDLPWRQTKDPYAIWLSEIILQQTQVKQGWDYWERFMHRWPTVEALAAATEDEVLREWQGLGYYSRARNLHYAAKQIVALGHFPNTLDEIKQLKGVGDYTAAAIGSIAFDLPAAVVDGNVYRVLARYFGIDTPINTTEGKKVFAAMAQELLPIDKASDYNQAIMDFGAIQCTPQSPRCLLCPLAESCEALHAGRVAELPVKQKTLKVRERHLIYIYVRCKDYVAIHRRGPGDIWQGLWEPYLIENGKLNIENLNPQSVLPKLQSSIFN